MSTENPSKLNKAETAAIYQTASPSEGLSPFEAIQVAWDAALVENASRIRQQQEPLLRPSHYLLYAAALGRDWRKGFTPIENRTKLANGAHYDWSLWGALTEIHSGWFTERLLAPFNGAITREMLRALRARLPKFDKTAIDALRPGPSRPYPFGRTCIREAQYETREVVYTWETGSHTVSGLVQVVPPIYQIEYPFPAYLPAVEGTALV